MTLLLRLLLRHIVCRGSLSVTTPAGQFEAGDGTGRAISIRLCDRIAVWRLIADPELTLGELFMDGRLIIESGSIHELLDLISTNLASTRQHEWAKRWERFSALFRSLPMRNTRARSRHNAAHHYDLDERLYSLFLDPDWQYSCAYFEDAEKRLDDAQRAKQRHILAKLLIEPHHRVCDIGCGWGGLAFYIAEHSGAHVTGITLSQRQLAIAQARARLRSLQSRAEFRLQDYRDVTERFDRIISVGMFEHVGRRCYEDFFAQVARSLTDDGIMLLHSIGRATGPARTNPWIAKYIFPGGYIPALSEVMPAIEEAGLFVTDVEILRLHYADTLRAWRERFVGRINEAKALYDERFCRMWEFYLAASECAFRHFGLVVFQIQLAKRVDAVPLTRAYIADLEATCGTGGGNVVSSMSSYLPGSRHDHVRRADDNPAGDLSRTG